MKSLVALLALLLAPPLGAADGDWFVDVAAEAGIDFVHFNGMTGELYLAETVGAGAALFDYDGDGDLDVYLVQGAMLDDKPIDRAVFAPEHPLPLSDRLYRNDLTIAADGSRTLRFTDVTEESGIAALARGYGMGVATGDYDDDGDIDLYLTNLGPNQMLRNEGPDENGVVTFADATAETGTGDPLWGVPAVFFDYDRDGRLDLFVGNYVDWRIATHKPCYSPMGSISYCSPSAFNPEPDRLFHNEGPSSGPGDGGRTTFSDATLRAKIQAEYGSALGATAADFDRDGWLDFYVANDGRPNQLWMNRKDGSFENMALLAGCSVNEKGQAEASMGVVPGDLDGDGDEDLFMTHLNRETNTLYVNDGTGLFDDRSQESQLGAPSFTNTGFGVGMFDYDRDGVQDLFVANGDVNLIEAQVRAGDELPLRQPNQLFRGRGDGTFEEVSGQAGEFFDLLEVSRGVAVGDVDEDGDPDLLMTNNSGPARLLINRVGDGRPWLGLRLIGGAGPRDMLGAAVELHRDGAPTLYHRVATDGSYASAKDPRVLFGLYRSGGDGSKVTKVVVRWPGGRVEEFPPPPVGAYTTLAEGTGKAVE